MCADMTCRLHVRVSLLNPGMANNQDEQKDKEDGSCTKISLNPKH